MILNDILTNLKDKGLEALNNLPPNMRNEMLKNLATIAEQLPDDIKVQLLKELLANPADLPPNLVAVSQVLKIIAHTVIF